MKKLFVKPVFDPIHEIFMPRNFPGILYFTYYGIYRPSVYGTTPIMPLLVIVS